MESEQLARATESVTRVENEENDLQDASGGAEHWISLLRSELNCTRCQHQTNKRVRGPQGALVG